jgi:hypothetical protein
MTIPYSFYASVGPGNHLTAAYWNSTLNQLQAGCTYLGDQIYQHDWDYLTWTYNQVRCGTAFVFFRPSSIVDGGFSLRFLPFADDIWSQPGWQPSCYWRAKLHENWKNPARVQQSMD